MCDLEYEGSLAIDLDLLDQANIMPYEKILVVNRSNGERLETYAIPAKRGSRQFALNGPAALKGNVGDIVTIMAFSVCTIEEAKEFTPAVIVLDEHNQIAIRKGRIAPEDML